MRDPEFDPLRCSASLPPRVKDMPDLGLVLHQATQLERENANIWGIVTLYYLMSFEFVIACDGRNGADPLEPAALRSECSLMVVQSYRIP
jgi:hypothetical protein